MATDPTTHTQPQKLFKAQTLKGFRDYMPELMAPRQAMIRQIEAVFERHGFQPLQTPALEYLETLAGKYGDEGDKLLYRFQDHGERHVALRYDLTVPLARVVAEHRNEIQLPFRRYQVAPVWRADKPQRGRFREFFQCDADIVGVNSALADAETLITGLSVLQALGIDGAVLHLNHRDVLFGLITAAGVTEKSQQIACIRAIDKLDKIPAAAVMAEIQTAIGVDAGTAERIVQPFVDPQVNFESVYAELSHLDTAAAGMGRVSEVLRLIEAAGLRDRVFFDPTIARGLDYYTGIIYETRLTDPRVKGIGAVMSGGRYDGLIGLFTKEAIPAVGISLGLDRLLAAMQELDLVAKDSHAVQVYVTVFGENEAATAIDVARSLRQAGLRVEMDLAGGKLGKQLERASKRGARLALMMGPEEAAAGTVVVKDLRDGAQQTVAKSDLPAIARSLLAI
jgi:histidyl-tRNA synthetase